MKKIILFLSIFAAFAVGGSALVSTASAVGPDCSSVYIDNVKGTGQFGGSDDHWRGNVTHCNPYVNQVQIALSGGGYFAELYDGTWNQNHYATRYDDFYGANNTFQINGSYNYISQKTYGLDPYCLGQLHVVDVWMVYRLSNSSNVWGPYHAKDLSAGVQIWC